LRIDLKRTLTESMNESDPNDETHVHSDVSAPQSDFSFSELPDRISRYRIEKVLGKGGFGLVYLAHDEQLNRRVALKVPHAELISKPEDAEAYLAEARTVANLDHPGIVPVHDVGSTENCACYIISKYVEGTDLAKKLKQHRIPYRESAELVAKVADALHYAHKKGLVHRDVKPSNILIGIDGNPYVVDFGLALREENIGKGPKYAGTPAYMSPEQARGEGHRVDGRSDVFSLGVMLYELLSGRQPFRGDTRGDLLEQVTSYEARPLRQYDEKLPKELERICHKAMAKRASERYTSAHDMAEDLRFFLHEQSLIQSGASPSGAASVTLDAMVPTVSSNSGSSVAASSSSMNLSSSGNHPIKIVPKGLRSFDAHDADFFLELLPGPRDREGLPESLRFWKTRIEETDADQVFSVGLVYGPSGCGKSSLVQAGLIPRLSEDVIVVYIEATPQETETRLLHSLRKRCIALEDGLSLKETLAALRRGQGIPFGKKVLIVIDQFEQWLHAKKEEENTELVQALRQCDGGRVQCIVMVRDDFWMAATRFMRELEVRLLEAQNSAAVDLFPIRHAEKVLAAFGRAFGALPDHLNEMSKEQKSFINQSVEGLAQEGKIICVRLALFAEMMKGKSWVPATLKAVGGAEGVGFAFLEETFSSATASPEHRYHQKATRAVLRDLLPDSGADIKGHMRSYAELLEASGYGNQPQDFDDLIRILDSEIRLITLTDPEGQTTENEPKIQTRSGQKYFQLTHDYLVHSLRDWLTRKQKETQRGRAELKLFDTSLTWNSKPENRFLPNWREHLSIRLLTDKKKWTESQQKMMAQAGRMHGLRSALAFVGLITVVLVGAAVRSQVVKQHETTRIEGLVGRLISAEPNQLPQIVTELDANPKVAATFLTPMISKDAKTTEEIRSRLHARLAMVARDNSLVEPLLEELLTNKLAYIAPIRQQLHPYAGDLIDKLRAILRDKNAEANRRFRAAIALADYIPDSASASWSEQDLQLVAGQLVSANAEFQPILRENLRAIHQRLLPVLERIFADGQRTDAQRLSAANAFADYAASDVTKLSRLLTVATPEQYAVLYPLVAASSTHSTVEDLSQIASTQPSSELSSVERVPYGQRRANAAVTLLQLGERERVLPVFDTQEDPEAMTQFIFRCRDRGVRVTEILDLFQIVSRNASKEPSDRLPNLSLPSRNNWTHARYALLLSLGEYSLSEIPESERTALLNQVADLYRNDPSSGIHGAAGWLLRQWGQVDIARTIDEIPAPYSTDREWFTLAVTVTPEMTPTVSPSATVTATSDIERTPLPPKTFFYTFVVFSAGEYSIGSLGIEPDRRKDEVHHSIKLSRPYALLNRELTFEETVAFSTKYAGFMDQMDAKPEDSGFGFDWYDSVAFCHWLSTQSGIAEMDQSYADPDLLDREEYPRETQPGAEWAPRNWPLQLERRGFRLPTEAGWEIASRSGVQTAYAFGSDTKLLDRFGWFAENSGKHVHPPCQLRPSMRGVFDLHGNLFEWTHDWYADYPKTMDINPLGPPSGSDRVLRGGGWSFDESYCRVSNRSTYAPSYRTFEDGLRLALSLPEISHEAQPSQGTSP